MASEGLNETITPQYPLYPYQRQVLRDIFVALSRPEKRVVAHLPTGAGKTRVAVHAACRLLNDADSENSLVIWLASAEELCEQAAEQLSDGWRSLGLREASIHRYWGSHSLDLRRLSSGFLVTGLAKLRSASDSDQTLLAHLAYSAAGVIFDEAHQAVARTYGFVTEQLCSTRPPLLGLTATPGRTANISEDDYKLAEMFSHAKVSIDSRGYEGPVTYLIQNRFLASPKFVPIAFEGTASIPAPVPGMDYSSHDLELIGQDEMRTRVIAHLAIEACRRHPRTIVFCPSVHSAMVCNKLLQAEGIQCGVITAKTRLDERQGIISAFKGDGREHMVIFNYGVLTAGFDAPRTRCVIVARPTTSLVLYSQMAGRAMRGPRSGGNSTAEILTVVDTTLPGFGSVTDAFMNWEDLWSNS